MVIMKTKTKKIKQLKITIPNRKIFMHEKWIKRFVKTSICSYKGVPVYYPYQLKLLMEKSTGKTAATDWNIYIKQLKQNRSKGYKQKIIISHP